MKQPWRDPADAVSRPERHGRRAGQLNQKPNLLTIQALQGKGLQWLDTIAGEHPEALE